ncbi:hypothetical protein [Saliphagus sp. LR7]|uniref:hypothetical protein n=1 Tax=Saliphagus sp. LR7 TaxID=2282654 RepID=UPI000DF8639F|nr:hypothetical protein [Saliphagus sp. LR7]
MGSGNDRFGGAAAIAFGSLLAAVSVLAVGTVAGEGILRNVAVVIVLLGAVVFAPTYLLYASWFDEFGDRR